MVIEEGFSQYTSLPARIARMEAKACQRSPVAINTASSSVRSARNSRMSRDMAQSEFPYLASASALTASRRLRLMSQMARN